MKREKNNLKHETGSRNIFCKCPRMFLSCLMLLASCFIFLLISSCGSLYGPGNNSTGDFSIGESSDAVTFDATDGGVVYQAVSFKNQSSDVRTVTNVIFANNLCADFSLHNVTDNSGKIVYSGTGSIRLDLSPGDTLKFNIRYSRTATCTHSDYETTFYIYYTDGNNHFRVSALLKALDGDVGPPFACDEITDQSENFTEKPVTGAPSDGSYFFRVDRMRGYMYVPSSGGILNSADLILGTDVNGLSPDDFITPFLGAEVSGTTSTLLEITSSNDFCLPAAEDNAFFAGAFTLLTSTEDFSGTIDADGNIVLLGADVMILTDGIPDDTALAIAEDNTFQISLVADFSTETLPLDFSSDTINSGLREASEQTDDDDDDLLPIEQDGSGNYFLQGSPPVNGKITLVGIGTFTNEDNTFIGADLSKQFLLEDEAYLFFFLDVTVTTENATE